ncbi:hypothetical protein O0L34_g5724 [Tuta absoluta]|nr:hypothetical protein O0L34_g5724 [Tuta absoluta]
MNFSPTWFLVLVCARSALAVGWGWPQDAQESVRIDTKVRFLDDNGKDKSVYTSTDITKHGSFQSDESPFRQPATTDGFYNRPPGDGRYPVQVVPQLDPYRVNSEGVYRVETKKNDRTDEKVTFCKCVSTLECNPRQDSAIICGVGKYLCCYKRPNKNQQINSEFFNEIEDERPTLFPGRERLTHGPFPPPPVQNIHPAHNEYSNHEAVNMQQPVIVGPGGPTGNIGPPQPQLLVGPGGPTGVVGPRQPNHDDRGLLVGPNGPSGVIGPREPSGVISVTHANQNSADNDRGVLVGPDGPTGVIGPTATHQNLEASAAAQRGVLVGPGGPTGIGPYGNRGVLSGPGGPTGIIGPNRSRGILVGPGGPTGIIGPGYGRQSRPGLLVGPGGPTGTIGPGRQLLTGPRGPTGRLGPQPYLSIY